MAQEIPITFYLEDQERPTYKKKISVEPETTLAEILAGVREKEIQLKILPENLLWFRAPVGDRSYFLDKGVPVERLPGWERSGIELCFMGEESLEKFIAGAVAAS